MKKQIAQCDKRARAFGLVMIRNAIGDGSENPLINNEFLMKRDAIDTALGVIKRLTEVSVPDPVAVERAYDDLLVKIQIVTSFLDAFRTDVPVMVQLRSAAPDLAARPESLGPIASWWWKINLLRQCYSLKRATPLKNGLTVSSLEQVHRM